MSDRNKKRLYLICGIVLLICGLVMYSFYVFQRDSEDTELDINNSEYQIKTTAAIQAEMQSQTNKISLLYKK